MNMNYIYIFVLFMIISGPANMVHGSCNQKSDSMLFDELLTAMSKIKCSGEQTQRDVIPAFGASTATIKSLAPDEIVKFEKVWTNIGNSYDSNTGVFIAPRHGIYQFSCSAMTGNGHTLRLHLYKNELPIVSLYPGTAGHNMGTLNMVLELNQCDRVYIKHPNTSVENSLYSESGSHFSMFSGYMISK